jgi:hypothetical protein
LSCSCTACCLAERAAQGLALAAGRGADRKQHNVHYLPQTKCFLPHRGLRGHPLAALPASELGGVEVEVEPLAFG